LAADNKPGSGDPIERAMRAKEKADESAGDIVDSVTSGDAKRDSILGSALDRLGEVAGSTETALFAAPKRDPEFDRYEPEERSFFSASAEERAEQARRAAQRVRRRVSTESASTEEREVELTPISRKKTAPANDAVTTPPSSSIMDRAIAQKPSVEAKSSAVDKSVPKASLKTDQTQNNQARKKTTDDLIARSAEKAGSRKVADVSSEPAPKSDPLLERVRAARATKGTGKRPAKLQTKVAETKSAKKTDTDLIAGAADKVSKRVDPPVKPSQSVADKIEARQRAPKTDSFTSKPSSQPAKKSIDAKSDPVASAAEEATTSTAYSAGIPSVFARSKSAAPEVVSDAKEIVAKAPLSQAGAEGATVTAIPSVESPLDRPLYVKEPSVTPAAGFKSAKTKAFAAFEWMIASRYLRARKKEGFVSVIAGFSLVGIALGVATLIVVMAVMTGFRETLISQIIGGSPHVNVVSQIGSFENFDEVADQIRTVDGVEYVTPVVQGQVLATGNNRHSGVLVRGMRKSDLERLIARAEPERVIGSLDNFFEDDGVALGENLAAKLGLRVGDFITLISPDGDITPFSATPLPRVKDYRVIQTFKLGVQEIDYNVAFMTFGEAQLYFNKQKEADTLDVFVSDAENVEKYRDPILGAVRSSIGLYDWKRQNGRLIGAINLERQVMFVILTMIILVAALNIISGLVMLVKDKARDVAIMRTMGMARGSILRIFFICGSSIGVVGSILGVVLGVLFVLNIHAIQGFVEWVTNTPVWDPAVRAGISEIPTKLQFSDVALTLFIALGLSFIATLFPAWKAAKLDPVEALRYE